MFALFNFAVFYLVAVGAPTYSIHVRELTAPEQAIRQKVTGSETVLDAVASLQRQPADLGRMDLWVVRRGQNGKVQVLRIDWAALTKQGATATNYQLLDGDQLFLQARLTK